MKQRITEEQWNELSDDEKKEMEARFTQEGLPYPPILYLSIGQMIEFLGDDLQLIENRHYWHIYVNGGKVNLFGKNLANILWTAVKEKLK